MALSMVTDGQVPNAGEELAAIDRLGRALLGFNWFARVGEALPQGFAEQLRSLMLRAGYENLPVQTCGSWSFACRLAVRQDALTGLVGDIAAELSRLRDLAAARHGADLLDAIVEDIIGLVSGTAHAAAVGAAILSGFHDGAGIREAARAAELASRAAILAVAAGEPLHVFVVLLGLFELGRWPIALIDGEFWIF